jgi:hypothetical protein
LAEKPVIQKRRYLSYLLRLWQESPGDPHGESPRDPPLWRASLERPQTGDRLGFASLVDLFTFLERETGTSLPESERSDESGYQPPAISE